MADRRPSHVLREELLRSILVFILLRGFLLGVVHVDDPILYSQCHKLNGVVNSKLSQQASPVAQYGVLADVESRGYITSGVAASYKFQDLFLRRGNRFHLLLLIRFNCVAKNDYIGHLSSIPDAALINTFEAFPRNPVFFCVRPARVGTIGEDEQPGFLIFVQVKLPGIPSGVDRLLCLSGLKKLIASDLPRRPGTPVRRTSITQFPHSREVKFLVAYSSGQMRL